MAAVKKGSKLTDNPKDYMLRVVWTKKHCSNLMNVAVLSSFLGQKSSEKVLNHSMSN